MPWVISDAVMDRLRYLLARKGERKRGYAAASVDDHRRALQMLERDAVEVVEYGVWSGRLAKLNPREWLEAVPRREGEQTEVTDAD